MSLSLSLYEAWSISSVSSYLHLLPFFLFSKRILIIVTVSKPSRANLLRLLMDPVLPIAVLSILIGAVIALAFFGNYFRKRSSEIQSISQPELQSDPKKQPSKPHQTKKSHAKPHSHTSDKVTPNRFSRVFKFCVWMRRNR